MRPGRWRSANGWPRTIPCASRLAHTALFADTWSAVVSFTLKPIRSESSHVSRTALTGNYEPSSFFHSRAAMCRWTPIRESTSDIRSIPSRGPSCDPFGEQQPYATRSFKHAFDTRLSSASDVPFLREASVALALPWRHFRSNSLRAHHLRPISSRTTSLRCRPIDPRGDQSAQAIACQPDTGASSAVDVSAGRRRRGRVRRRRP